MDFLIQIIPGIGFACAVILLIISLIQLRIYLRKFYLRSFNIGLFCFFAALFSLEHCLVQSRLFSGFFLENYVSFSTICLCLSMIFYIRSLNFFVAIPAWVRHLYFYPLSLFAGLSLVALVGSLFFDFHIFIDPQTKFQMNNYFIESYTSRIGAPTMLLNAVMFATSILTVLMSVVIFRIILRSSQDIYFLTGLVLSVSAVLGENFLLPFTYEYFVPMIFYSNLFEAFRMNNLSIREYFEELGTTRGQNKTEQEKYQNSSLTRERIEKLALEIKLLFEREKVFVNPNLSSEDLARKIGIPQYQLSQVVNIGLKTTFFELLSFYRIQHVKELFEKDECQEKTIINIAYDSGFNSKSTFNTAFKKHTGVTPSIYRKQIKN